MEYLKSKIGIWRSSVRMMMMLIGTCLSGHCNAQKIYSVDHGYQADVKVFVADAEYKADLVVFKTNREYRAKKEENKGIWFFTDRAYQADKKVYFVDRAYQADLKVFFTDKEYRAGWKNHDKKPLMY